MVKKDRCRIFWIDEMVESMLGRDLKDCALKNGQDKRTLMEER